MGTTVLLNPFTGTLQMSIAPKVKSIPIEIFNDNDTEFTPATYSVEFNQPVYKFYQGGLVTLRGRFKVPEDYINGRIYMAFTAYSPSVSDTYQFTLRSFLYNKTVDAVGSEALYNDYDCTLVTNVAPANLLQKSTIEITDAVFKIGGAFVTAGSLIDFRLQRKTLLVGDDAADIRIIPHIEVIKV